MLGEAPSKLAFRGRCRPRSLIRTNDSVMSGRSTRRSERLVPSTREAPLIQKQSRRMEGGLVSATTVVGLRIDSTGTAEIDEAVKSVASDLVVPASDQVAPRKSPARVLGAVCLRPQPDAPMNRASLTARVTGVLSSRVNTVSVDRLVEPRTCAGSAAPARHDYELGTGHPHQRVRSVHRFASAAVARAAESTSSRARPTPRHAPRGPRSTDEPGADNPSRSTAAMELGYFCASMRISAHPRARPHIGTSARLPPVRPTQDAATLLPHRRPHATRSP